ncbi:MAG: ABC transporter substrate-binding protein [Bacteriovoracaceae bacterium]|nr:ABC transporter substrate-binding protein [Bacteriovoracaceae bacterium]
MKTLLFFLVSLLTMSKALAVNCEDQKIIESYKPSYAKLFKIHYYENFKIVESGRAEFNSKADRFIVTDKKLNCSTSLPLFKGNSTRFVATSTTHLPFLNFFKLHKTLVGFQGLSYIYDPLFNKQLIKEINFDLNPEELLSLKSDIMIAYPENLRRPERLRELRKLMIPIVLNHDLEEKHPLARAEWIVFMSLFFNKDKEAKKLFNEIAKNYEDLKKDLSTLLTKNILVGEIQNGRWVTCGGKSDLALLISDAGGKLALNNTSSQTQYLSLEKVLKITTLPEIWLPQNTWADKASMKLDSRYEKFSSITIFNNINRLNQKGFNDYWEGGLARPDHLLMDLAKILHPEKYPQVDMAWYKELK